MSNTQVERAIRRLQAAGHRQVDIAQEMSRSQSTVSRVIGQDQVSKNVKSKGGRRRTTSAADDRCFQRLAAKNRFSSVRSLTKKWQGSMGILISNATTYRRLKSLGFQSRIS